MVLHAFYDIILTWNQSAVLYPNGQLLNTAPVQEEVDTPLTHMPTVSTPHPTEVLLHPQPTDQNSVVQTDADHDGNSSIMNSVSWHQ